MSDTPRTKNATFTHYDEMLDEEFEYVRVDFAEKQERESNQLVKQCVKNVEEIGQMRAELSTAKKDNDSLRAVLKSWKEDEGQDAKRLEWLLSDNGSMTIEIDNSPDWCNSRDAIDEAMKEDEQGETMVIPIWDDAVRVVIRTDSNGNGEAQS